MAALIKVRKLDPVTWEPGFGHGQNDFLSDADAVVQIIQQKLRLFRGEWWESLDLGTPWFGSMSGGGAILGTPADGAYKTAASDLIRSQILSTPYVLSVQSISIVFNASNRTAAISYSVTTQFGAVTSSAVIPQFSAVLPNE